jgi:hypothetical protein
VWLSPYRRVAGSVIASAGYRYLVRFVVLVGMQVPVFAPPLAMLSSAGVSVRMVCRRSDRLFAERFIDVSSCVEVGTHGGRPFHW